jgi:hypothetical protein
MRIFVAPMLLGALALTGVSPVAAQSKPVSDQGTSVGVAPTRDPAEERNSYTQKARDEVRIWEQKLHDFDAKVQTSASEAKTSATKDLNDAWTQTKTASARLETAGEKDWDSAKASFQTASHKLAVAWHKLNPADK